MSETLTIDLHSRQQAWVVIKEQLYPFLKRWLQDERRLVLICRPRTRTPKQNKRYWGKGVLVQIAEQAVINGAMFSADTWHEQFKRQFIGVIPLPNGQVIGKSSKDLSTTEFSAFCLEVEAFAATALNVTFYELAPA